MNALYSFYQSTIGKKMIMAITGVALFGFLGGHLAGNLLIFQGPEHFNEYAAFLKSKPALIWSARIGLLTCLVLHVLMSIQLAITSLSGRPQGYFVKTAIESNYASRTMRWTGPLVALFIGFHLAHYTLLLTNPEYANLLIAEGELAGHPDVFRMVIAGFSNPIVSGFYIASMLLLCFHLYHGLWSFFQTLGLNHPKYNTARRVVAGGIAIIIALGFLSIPVAVLTGIVGGTH